MDSFSGGRRVVPSEKPAQIGFYFVKTSLWASRSIRKPNCWLAQVSIPKKLKPIAIKEDNLEEMDSFSGGQRVVPSEKPAQIGFYFVKTSLWASRSIRKPNCWLAQVSIPKKLKPIAIKEDNLEEMDSFSGGRRVVPSEKPAQIGFYFVKTSLWASRSIRKPNCWLAQVSIPKKLKPIAIKEDSFIAMGFNFLGIET